MTDPDTAPLRLIVKSIDEPLAEGGLLEGAEICQTDNTANCERTDETGEVIIELPIGETSFTMEANGHVPYLVPVMMPHLHDFDLVMRTDGYLEAEFAHLMSDYPMVGTGAIVVSRYQYAAGATFELESTEALGPFYAGEDGWWSFDLTATIGNGRAGFVEVPPGDRHTIRAGGTAEDCSAWWGWPGEDENSFHVPVLANHLTYFVLLCF
ncbi:MAG: hypothetical protein JRE81_15710 [Deltaproteobacteria bacterium]|nr:hypothetical protein [Deltaproteobacteria bacterium]